MKHTTLFILALLLAASPTFSYTSLAQQNSELDIDDGSKSYVREIDEKVEGQDVRTLSKEDQLLDALNGLSTEADRLLMAFGYIDDKGNHIQGALDRLKLKPSDKKRLAKISNGSLTDKQKEKIMYDERTVELLTRLVTPSDLGGSGLDHLRVGDFLRFRADPRSYETENADNISAHYKGRAFDITEINTTYCIEKTTGPFGVTEKALPPFPVKVLWQGGAPYNPSSTELASYDSILRAKALHRVLGTLPANGFDGETQGLYDVLDKLQRRALAQELGLELSSLDFANEGDFLENLGRISLNKQLGLAPGALAGNSADERIRSIPRAYFEQSMQLPPGSFTGNDLPSSLERLGRTIVAANNGLPTQDVLNGNKDTLEKVNYYTAYRRSEAAFDLPVNTISGIRSNNAGAFRAVAAQHLARKLRYDPQETETFVNQANRGDQVQLSLARFGDLSNIPMPTLLPMIAPATESSKSAGEKYLGETVLNNQRSRDLDTLDPDVRAILGKHFSRVKNSSSQSALFDSLLNAKDAKAYREVGAAQMEKAFDLPDGTLVELVSQSSSPNAKSYGIKVAALVLNEELTGTFTKDEFDQLSPGEQLAVEGKQLRTFFNSKRYADIIDRHLHLQPGTTQQHYDRKLSSQDYLNKVGEAYIAYDFMDSFRFVYPVPSAGIAKVSSDQALELMLGKQNRVNTIAGASWVEEDLGMVPDSLADLVANGNSEDRLVNAGVAVLAGHLFEAFDVDTTNIDSLATLTNRIGQARAETTIGLTPGSLTSLENLKQANDRFSDRFASPSTVDTIWQVDSGTTAQFLAGSMPVSELVSKVGKRQLEAYELKTLHTKLGWSDEFKLLEEKEEESQEKPQTIADLNGNTLRQLLAKVGAYNTDYSFGYDPGTIQKWINAPLGAEQDAILTEQGAKLYGKELGLDSAVSQDFYSIYKSDDSSKESRVIDELSKATSIPVRDDTTSFVRGNMYQATLSRSSAGASKKISENLSGNTYELLRSSSLGWSSDESFITPLRDKHTKNYSERLRDYELLKQTNNASSSPVDPHFTAVTQGSIGKDGKFTATRSPYSTASIDQIKRGYFTTKAARSELFYDTLDATMGKRSSSVPEDFSWSLMEGSSKRKSDILVTFLNSKKGQGILNSLPSELHPTVTSWLNTRDLSTAQTLAGNGQFTNWVANSLTNFSDQSFTPDFARSVVLVGSSPDGAIISEDPSLITGFNAASFAGLINKQLGLESGIFGDYYSKYSSIQSTFADYKSGSLDQSQALFAADALLFDGKVAKLTQGIDKTLGLPDGSTQLLVSYAITQNPLYLAQFGLNLFGGGTTVVCPDLQKEAQNNVKTLLKAVIEQANNTSTLIANQVITFNQNYITELSEDINLNYSFCQTRADSRCGVFARPEYSEHVHIGF